MSPPVHRRRANTAVRAAIVAAALAPVAAVALHVLGVHGLVAALAGVAIAAAAIVASVGSVRRGFDEVAAARRVVTATRAALAEATTVDEADEIVRDAASRLLTRVGPVEVAITREGEVAGAGPDVLAASAGDLTIVARTTRPAGQAAGEALELVAAALVDRCERLALEIALRHREDRFRALVQNAPDAITVHAGDGEIVYASPSVARFGAPPADLLGSRWDSQVLPDDLPHVRARVEELLRAPGAVTAVEYRWVRPDGTVRWVESTLTNQLDDPVVQGVIANHRDVTDRHELEDELTRQAFTDALTGLPNRATLIDRTGQAIARALRTGEHVGMLYLDVDRFKGMNDTYGHAAGDEILVTLADRLRASIRPGDTAARLGGDEFAILLDPVQGVEGALTVARRVHEAFEPPIVVGDQILALRASIGVAVSDAERQTTDESLLRDADAALYIAKAKGRGRIELFDPDVHGETLERLRLETELRAALLDRRQLRIQYQPVVRLRTGEITGFEALVRWHHPDRGLIMPDTFIPVAEEIGVITQIGAHVLSQACMKGAALQSRTSKRLTVCVNVSPGQFLDSSFPSDVARVVGLAGIEPSQLLLEITEGSLLRDVDAAVAALEELRELGVRIAIDDFGTGYSSLGYLRRLPVDVLKVDRSFVAEVAGSPEESAVAQAVIRLARTFRLEAVAEGIENEEQLDALLRLGCELGQGYLFAEPLDDDDLDAAVAEGTLPSSHRPKAASPDGDETVGSASARP